MQIQIFSIIKKNVLILFTKMIDVCSENHSKYINTAAKVHTV